MVVPLWFPQTVRKTTARRTPSIVLFFLNAALRELDASHAAKLPGRGPNLCQSTIN
jgi:hypothetical protein